MPVPNTMSDLATLASSNFPAGTEAIGNSLDNYIRALSAIIRSTNAVSSATIAAASTTNIAGADGESVLITGAATINSLGAGFIGCVRELIFTGTCTIVSSSIIVLPFAQNVVVDAGNCATFRCTALGVWTLVSRVGGDVLSKLAFIGNGTSVVVSPTTSGGVFLRPNGPSSTTGQSIINSAGILTVGGRIRAETYVGSTTEDLVVSCAGGTMIFRPNGEGNGTNGATLTASNGDFSVAGNLISGSDRRLKSNIKPIKDGLARVMRMRGCTYTKGNREEVGVIAQEMLLARPEAVSVPENPDEMMGVDYGKITPDLIEAVKEIATALKNKGIL